jgi:hypothetical protein
VLQNVLCCHGALYLFPRAIVLQASKSSRNASQRRPCSVLQQDDSACLPQQQACLGATCMMPDFDRDPPQRLPCLTVDRPVLNRHNTVGRVCQLLKRPEGQVKVVIAAAAPVLGANLCNLAVWSLDGVLAGARVTHAHHDGLAVIPALGVEQIVLQLGVSCKQQSQTCDMLDRAHSLSCGPEIRGSARLPNPLMMRHAHRVKRLLKDQVSCRSCHWWCHGNMHLTLQRHHCCNQSTLFLTTG